MTLSNQDIAILKGVIYALQAENTPYVSMKTAYDYYKVVWEEQEIQPMSYTSLKEIVRDLSYRGIVDYVEERGIGIAGASLEDLSIFLRSLERGRRLAL